MGRLRQGPKSAVSSTAQTLDRGITALEAIAFSREPVDVTKVAEQMEVSKSVAYRLVRTLEARNLVRRTAASRYEPSLYLGRLGAKSYRPLQESAVPHMKKLADAVGHTAYIAMQEGEEISTVWVEEPSIPEIIAYRPSVRHPIGRGATWLAFLAGQEAGQLDTREVVRARERGYALTTGQVIPGLSAMASPITVASGECVGVLAVIFLDRDEDTHFIGRRLLTAAQLIGDDLA